MSSHLSAPRLALLLLPLAACAHQSGPRGRVLSDGVPFSDYLYSGAAVLPTADRYVGVKYRWGGESPVTGFDCSGFTQFVFAKHGIRIPRTSRAQVAAGDAVPVNLRALRAGDLIMFANSGQPISHVAIYAGNGRIIHSSSSGRGVRYDDLSSRRGAWYRNHMVAVRRIHGVVVAEQPAGSDRVVRDFVRELRSAGIRVDFPFDVGDVLAPHQ